MKRLRYTACITKKKACGHDYVIVSSIVRCVPHFVYSSITKKSCGHDYVIVSSIVRCVPHFVVKKAKSHNEHYNIFTLQHYKLGRNAKKLKTMQVLQCKKCQKIFCIKSCGDQTSKIVLKVCKYYLCLICIFCNI
jgi:hypothetical protein